MVKPANAPPRRERELQFFFEGARVAKVDLSRPERRVQRQRAIARKELHARSHIHGVERESHNKAGSKQKEHCNDRQS